MPNLNLPENIEEKFTSFGIEFHPTLQIVDSTKCLSWNTCKRKFFYEYILGWSSDVPSNHLVFGDAYHIGQEVIHTKQDFSPDTITEAYQEAESRYRREFPIDSDELYEPKTMVNLLKSLIEYAKTYHDDFEKYETKYVEVGGSVPIRIIPSERRLHFRMDALMHDKENDYFFCREHKTSGASGMFRQKWREDFDLRIQIGTYTHAMYCIFPKEKVRGVEVNGCFFKKLKAGPKLEFERVPCWWQPDRMANWLWRVNNIFDEIEYEYGRLAECNEADSVMQAFPLNETQCQEYFGCAYHSYCTAWPNPLQNCHEVPVGMHIKRWDPSQLESLKHKMDLQMGG